MVPVEVGCDTETYSDASQWGMVGWGSLTSARLAASMTMLVTSATGTARGAQLLFNRYRVRTHFMDTTHLPIRGLGIQLFTDTALPIYRYRIRTYHIPAANRTVQYPLQIQLYRYRVRIYHNYGYLQRTTVPYPASTVEPLARDSRSPTASRCSIGYSAPQ